MELTHKACERSGPNCHFYIFFLHDLFCCHLHNRLRVTFLHISSPQEREEMKDPGKFPLKLNLSTWMGDQRKIPVTKTLIVF